MSNTQLPLDMLELINKAKELKKLVKPRKERSDKGMSHDYPLYVNKVDKPMNRNKMAIYNRVMSRLANRANQQITENGQSLLSKEFDVNYYYYPIPETKSTKAVNYKQIIEGRVINHTIQNVVTQKFIDLEKYRFEALQEETLKHPLQPVPEGTKDFIGLCINRYNYTMSKAHELLKDKRVTWEDFFAELYYVKPEQISLWTYENWRKEYDKVPPGTDLIDINFENHRFDVNRSVLDVCPEWKYYTEKKKQQTQQDEELEQQRRREQYKSHFKKGGI